MPRLVTLAAVLALSVRALADDATTDAWTKLKEARAKAETINAEAQKKAADTKDRDEKMKIFSASWKESAKVTEPAEAAFLEAFGKSDWNSWDAAKDGELLEEGLNAVGEDQVEKNPKRALEAWELLLKKLPKCASSVWVRSSWMPIVLPAAGDLDAAEKRLAELKEEVESDSKPDLAMAIGDVEALKGDPEGAQKIYAEALAAIPKDADPKNSAAGRAKAGLEMRVALIGKPAPEVDSKTWFGAEAKPLSALKGRVVLMDFWATWCGPCTTAIPGLEEIQRETGPKDLFVFGVTMFYDHGFIPKDRAELPKNMKDGDSAQKMDKEGFLKHLQAFRDRLKIEIPSVVGEKSDFQNYKITGIPTIFVIDRDGVVRFLVVGGKKDGLLKAAVKRLVAEKGKETK